jgi:hypothetical protein
VPRRSITVPGFEINGLRVAFVTAIVVSAVTQVDPADERHVIVGSGNVAHDDELLVMASTAPDALVKNHFPAGLVDFAHEPGILLLEIVRPTRVRTPYQAAHVNATPRQIGEHAPDLCARAGETLVGIALPVSEVHPVAPLARAEDLVQTREIFGAVDQNLNPVALRPGLAVAASPIDIRRRVAALPRGQEPII